MIFAGLRIIDNHAVAAHKTVNQRLDTNGAQSTSTVTDNDTSLYNITWDNFCLKAGVYHLDIHPAVCNLAAFKPRTIHLTNNGKNHSGNIQIVDAAVAVA